jgi:RecA-family ATPase
MIIEYAPEIENQSLGLILMDTYVPEGMTPNAVMDNEASGLFEELFGSPLHRDIFRAMKSLHARGIGIDELLILSEMDTVTGNPTGAKIGEIRHATAPAVDDANLTYQQKRTRLSDYIAVMKEQFRKREADKQRELIEKAARQDYSAESIIDLAQGLRDLEADTRKRRLKILTAEEAEDIEPAQGILGNLLYESSIAFLYGKSGRWKSFLVLAMAFAIAVGGRLFGRQAKQAPVFYIAAEGNKGIGKRITGLRQRQALQGARVPLYPVVQPISLLDAAAITDLIAEIRDTVEEYDDGAPPALVVFDTLSWSMPGGDENSTKDINTVYAAAGRIRDAFGCCVLIIHHKGKDSSKGARGSSAIFNSADTVLRVTSSVEKPKIEPGEALTLQCDKPKEAEGFEDIRSPPRWSAGSRGITSSTAHSSSCRQARKRRRGTNSHRTSRKCLTRLLLESREDF